MCYSSASVIEEFKLDDLKYLNVLEDYFCLCLSCLFKLIFLAEINLFVRIFTALDGMKYGIRDNRVVIETTKSTTGIFFDFLV